MDDKNQVSDVPYIVHEAAQARQERTIKRLWILCIVVFCAFVASNLYWLNYEMQFEDVVTVSQNAQTGDAPIYLNGTGEQTVNGQGKTDNN